MTQIKAKTQGTRASTDCLERVKKATIMLLLDHPFFGTLATRLENVVDDRIPTACTDGKKIRWSTAFLEELTDAQVRGVVAHEVMHVAMGHFWRRDGREMMGWNIATDKAINHVLRDSKLELPAGALYPDRGDEGHAAEHYYQAGKQDKQGGGGGKGTGNGGAPGGGNDPGGCGGVEDAPCKDEAEAEALESEWRVAVAQATITAQGQGKMPASLERLVNEIVNPKVPWAIVLRDFVDRTARNDYNWSLPNRRHLQRGFALPSLISDELPQVVVAVDTSGSIGGPILDQFAAEISAVLGEFETTIEVVYADAAVANHETFTRADLPLALSPKGGGGTDFRPVFRYVAEQGLTPACVIYLTDGYGTFPEAEAEWPTLWVMISDVKAPWGETIKIEN